jgi:hypothetical protein
VIAASVRALCINSAQTALTVQIEAIVVAHALEGEDLGLLAVTLDVPSFCRRLAMFFAGSPRSNSSTMPMRSDPDLDLDQRRSS